MRLTAERWLEVKALLAAALERAADERAAFVDEACGADDALRFEARALLDAAERADEGLTLDDAWRGAAVRAHAQSDADAARRNARNHVERLAAALDGRYLVERELGRGGMATVYLARDLRHRRPVALKVLHPDLGALLGPTRFRREIETAANLRHPHILPLFDSGEADGLIYYTMPYVAGETLRARLTRDGALPIPVVIGVIRDIAKGLAYAHRHGVVHRDIKPANILLEDGNAILADFGIARAVHRAREAHEPVVARVEGDGAGALTDDGAFPGTPGYMAPEQSRGALATDHRADLYALGVVAYEALAGTHPFDAHTPEALIAAHRGETPLRLDARRSDVPPALTVLVMRALEKDPADRPGSADEVLRALDALESLDPLPAAEVASSGSSADTTREPRAPLTRSKRRARVAVVTALALVLAGAGGGVWYRAARSPEPLVTSRVLVVPFENATGDTALGPLGRMAADWIAQGLAQTGTVRVSAELARPPGGDAGLRAAAVEYGAGTVVSGAYYLDGDSVRLQARVTDVANWTLRAVSPVSAPRVGPMAALEPVRQRVMAVVVVGLDPRSAGWNLGAPPPTYAAYEQFLAGLEVFAAGDWRGAIPHWNQAAALDSAYVLPILHVSQAYLNLGENAAADSVARLLDPRRGTLTPFDRGLLDYLHGSIDGNSAMALDGARAMVSAAPGMQLPHYLHGYTAVRANHPREALEAATKVTYRFGRFRRAWSAQVYWRMVTDSHHMLGNYQDELEAARAALRYIPENRDALACELRALAALGRIEEVQSKLDQFEAASASPGASSVPALLISLADELRVHDQLVASRLVLRRAIDWQISRPREEQAPTVARELLATTLARLSDDTAADTLLAKLVAEQPEVPRYVAAQALLAARRGERDRAARLAARLRAHPERYDRGQTTYALAEIAAQLGDTAEAMMLLRRAFAEGMPYGPAVHSDPQLAPLRAERAFQELLRARG